jgi:hypothetical protein
VVALLLAAPAAGVAMPLLDLKEAVRQADEKLAAARAARDAPPKASPAGAPATGSAPAAAPETKAASPAAGTDKAGELAQLLAYGDSLVAAGEPGDAVRTYERARRLAQNEKLPYDRAGLDAKIAAASAAAAAPKAPMELVPLPPPPMPVAPGTVADRRYLWKHPGTVRAWKLPRTFVIEENRITPAELQALEASLRKIEQVVLQAPVVKPPVGFDLWVHAALGTIPGDVRSRHLAGGLPLPADIGFDPLSAYQNRLPTGAFDAKVDFETAGDCSLRIWVNRPPSFGVQLADPGGEFFLEPRKDGELGGLPVYDGTLLVLRPGQAPWVPVGAERVLRYLLPKYQAAAESAGRYAREKQKAYQDFMSPAAKEKRQREAQALRAAGGSGAEDNARRLEKKQARWEEDARKEAEAAASDPKWRGPIEAFEAAKARLAGLDQAGRAAPACVVTGFRGPESDWKVVPVGTPGCQPVVRTHPDLLRGKLPRGAVQFMYVPHITDARKAFADGKRRLTDLPGDCVATSQLLRQLDWAQLTRLLAP